MKVTGRIKVKVDGELLRSKPGATLQIGGVKRKPVPNDQGTVDYMEETAPAQVKATLIHVAGTDLRAINDFVDGTVIFETDTGHVFTIPDAFCEELGELKEGEVEVTFGGSPTV